MREEVLRRIKPDRDEEKRLWNTVDEFLSRANEELVKRGFEEDAILVGSVAKGTYLKNPDIDIFLRLPPDTDRKTLKMVGIDIGKAIIPDGFAKYAEHPYWRGTYNGFEVDIVPCYKINDPKEKISAVDRTPFHTEYIKSHIKDWQRDEVRLLKAFLKGIGAYGAEAKIQGFSGYLTELLILKYGDFLNTLKNVAKWRRKVYLYLEIGGTRFRAPVVFIDPVDPDRNAASAVGEERKSLFIYAAKSYMKSPKLEFFFPRPIEPMGEQEIKDIISKRDTNFLVIRVPRPDIIEDNLYPQIERSMYSFLKILADFEVVSHFYIVQSDYVYFIIEVARDRLPRIRVHEGPPVWHENSDNFIKRWRGKALRGPYIRGNRWYADIEREACTVREVFFKNLQNYKIGKEFEKIKKELVLGSIYDFMGEIDRKALTEFFMAAFPWER